MPVPTEVWGVDGHGDQVAHPFRDVAVAAGAQVALRSLIGLDEAGLDGIFCPQVWVAHPRKAHATSAATTSSAAITMT